MTKNVFLLTLAIVFLTSCGSDSSSNLSAPPVIALVEKSFVEDTNLRATENNIVVVNLEPSNYADATNDTDILGVDTIPFKITTSFVTQLEVENNSSVPVESMYITDTTTDIVVALATKGNPSQLFTLEANRDYDLTVEHTNVDTMVTLFIKFNNINAPSLRGVNLVKSSSFYSNINKLETTRECVECNLSGLDAPGSNFSYCMLRRANLNSANLSDANLSHTVLMDVNLSMANLDGANLSNAFLYSASFDNAFMEEANLSYANLEGAVLTNADLTSSDMSGTTLAYANANGAYMRYVNLLGAKLINHIYDTPFSYLDVDLTGATWVDGSICAEDSIGECIK